MAHWSGPISARSQAEQPQANPDLQPCLERLPAPAAGSAELGERVKRGRARGKPVEQPGLPSSRKVRELVEGLELGAGAQKGGKPAIAQETKEWFERHYLEVLPFESAL